MLDESVLSTAPTPVDAIARLASRLVDAPMAVVTLVGSGHEHLAGGHGLPGAVQVPMAACVPVNCADLAAVNDPVLREHPLATRYGVRAVLGVPVRDGDGDLAGSLAVLDTAVRCWTGEQVAVLTEIAELLRPVTAAASTVTGLDTASLLDGVQEAFLAVDTAGVVVGWNRAARDLLGYTAEEICGRRLDAGLLPDYDGQPVRAALDRLFAAGSARPALREVSVRHRDGHRLAARAALSVIPATTGLLACVFLTDLSRQAAAEDAAERHASFLAALLDSLSVGVMACDDSGRIVVANRALREVQRGSTGADGPADFTAMTEAPLLNADLTPMPWEQTPLMRALRGEHVQDTDVLIRAGGRQVRTFASAAQPITAGDGRSLGAVTVAQEVTAMRRVERFRLCHLAVARALAGAVSAAEATPAVLEALGTALHWPYAELWLTDTAGDTLEPVGRWCSPGTRLDRLVGHTVVKGVGITGQVWATGRPKWVPELRDAPDLLVTPEARARTEACLREGIRSVLAVPVRDGDTLLGVLTCYADAPEHHEDLLTVLLDGVAAQIGMFVALRRAENLARQLVRAQDDFVALVSHELRTPLTAITATVTMLGEDRDTLDEEQRAMLSAIERNTTALRTIVDTLLDLAALDHGNVGLTATRVDLARLVTEAVAATGPVAAGNGVRLSTTLPPQLFVEGDPARLRQVVDDLLSNAVKYSPPGGEVAVRLGADGSTAELHVCDEGIGIPAGERDRLFERFYRASNVRHQGTAGSGLGLSRARTIVRLHGGTITLTDRRPCGTTALVRLPLRSPASDG